MDRRERTIPDLVERFLDHLQQSRNYSPYTIKAYRGDIRQLCEFLDRSGYTRMVSHVDERIIYEYDDDLRGITASTRCRKMHSLSSFFRYAMKRGYTGANPVAGIELPKKKRRLPVYLNDDEISRLLQSVVTPIEKAVLTTFV